MKKKSQNMNRILIGIMLLSGFLLVPPQLLASCGQAFCPIETSSLAERPLLSGHLSLNIVHEYIDSDQPRIGTSKARVGEFPRDHDEVFTQNHTTKFSLDYGITPRLSVGILIPFLQRHHRHILQRHHHHIDHDEQEAEEENSGGGHVETEFVDVVERWTYRRLGDIQVTTRYRLNQPLSPLQPSFSLIAGVKLPTGKTDVKNDTGEEAELTLQPGNGSWDGILGFSYLQSFSLRTLRGKTALAPLFVTGLSQFPVSVGKFNFKPGTELFFNLGFAYPLFWNIEFLGQINFHYQDRVSVGHAPGVEQPDTGRETLFLSPGVRYQLTKNIHLYALAQFPVYQRVNGIQIASDWNLATGVSFRFNLSNPLPQA